MKKNTKKLQLNKLAVAKLSNTSQIKGGSSDPVPFTLFCSALCDPPPFPDEGGDSPAPEYTTGP